MTKISPRPTVTQAMHRAMVATHAGHVVRIYRKDGNIMKCRKPGIAPGTLWQLLAFRLIEDEPGTDTGTLVTTCRMRLTSTGINVMGIKQ